MAVPAEADTTAAIPATVTVPADANIFGASHAVPPAPGGEYAPGDGGGAGEMPIALSLQGAPSGSALIFPTVTGTVSCQDTAQAGADGGGCGWNNNINVSSYGGISGLVATRGATLVGVFTGATEASDPAPAVLSFIDNADFEVASYSALESDFFHRRRAYRNGQRFPPALHSAEWRNEPLAWIY
jgi:hypothetical protein